MNPDIDKLDDVLPLATAGCYWIRDVGKKRLQDWATRGIADKRTGCPIKLRTYLVGIERYVCKSDAIAFQRAVEESRQPPAVVTSAARRTDRQGHNAAMERLHDALRTN